MFELQIKRYIKVIILGFILAVVFIFVNSYIVRSIENYLYDTKKSEAITVSKDYAQNVVYSSHANDLISALFEEKIIVASKIVKLERLNIMDLELNKLAKLLEIDQIHYYDEHGRIVASSIDQYLNWKAYEGHPVYEFMQSNKKLYVEDNIRIDSRTKESYKYGYYRLTDNTFIQVAIDSSRVEEYLSEFELSKTLKNINESDQIVDARFYYNDFRMLDHMNEAKRIIAPYEKSLLTILISEDNRIYTRMNRKENFLEVYVPVRVESSIIGALAIDFSFKDIQNLVSNISKVSILVFILIYSFIIYIITSNVNMNQRLIDLVYYDSLTGLPNVEYFMQVYNEETNATRKHHDKVVFVIKFISIPIINMTHGYKSGSELLKRITKRLEMLSKNEDIDIFKLDGNEFVLYWKVSSNNREIIEDVSKINSVLARPFIVNKAKIFIKFKIAIINKENNHLDKIELLKESNITLNSINTDSERNYAFYDKAMEVKLHRIENIKNELQHIVETDNREHSIYMNYQPLIDLKTERVIGFEALARFKSVNYGSVSPFEFIKIAEENRLIIPLSYIIIEESSRFLHMIKSHGYHNIKIAMNISGTHLLSEGFVSDILELERRGAMDLTMVELEVTESLLINNFSLINKKLEQLRTRGISISLDDFGTGYSSFARLGELNVDFLKIDKSFIDKILTKEEKDIIAGEIIAMAHRFGMKVVAEGVEERAQLEYLKKYDCDIIQGYYYSKPRSEKDALDYIKKQD